MFGVVYSSIQKYTIILIMNKYLDISIYLDNLTPLGEYFTYQDILDNRDNFVVNIEIYFLALLYTSNIPALHNCSIYSVYQYNYK